MATRRTTNNSVSTLEEQTEVLQSILTKESTVQQAEAKTKKAHKRKDKSSAGKTKKAKVMEKPAALGSRMDDSEPEIELGQPAWPSWAQAQAHVHSNAGLMVLGITQCLGTILAKWRCLIGLMKENLN